MDVSRLPPYEVRRSSRARQARLTYHPRNGLTVVLPPRYDARHVPELVARHLAWIRRAQSRLGGPAVGDPRRDGPFPELLSLRALGEEWSVRYEGSAARAGVRTGAGTLVAPGGDSFAAAQGALARWVSGRARETLVPATLTLAERLGARVGRVSIRAQQSRWGSCSSGGTISLNRNLLFLPPPLGRLVLLHELCHLQEMNHSPRFWSLLTSHEPAARRLTRELRDSWRYVPAWLEPAGGGAR